MMEKNFYYTISIILALTILFQTVHANSSTPEITDYHPVLIPGYDEQNNLQIAIRMYHRGNNVYYLLVNPNTFKTQIQLASQIKTYKQMTEASGYVMLKDTESSPYMQALNRYTKPPYITEDYGVIQSEHKTNGMFLTVDMCPSKKSFEANFFKSLVSLSDQKKEPIPVNIAISGLWMLKHPAEMDWLIKQQAANKLNITWINHTFSHVYYRDLPPEKNFLLTDQNSLAYEILETEKILLSKNQLPSVFFRFPGLISNEHLVLGLRQFGLIPVGSNAWLAKKEIPTEGSIILVHGNSNEPEGIKMVMPILQQPNLKLLPLNQLFLMQDD